MHRFIRQRHSNLAPQTTAKNAQEVFVGRAFRHDKSSWLLRGFQPLKILRSFFLHTGYAALQMLVHFLGCAMVNASVSRQH
jgi:hypothetical protein